MTSTTYKIKITNGEQFAKALKGLVNAQKNVKKHARNLAEYAISQVDKAWNFTPANELYDALDGRLLNKRGFVNWMVAHAPVKLEDGRFIRDKSRKDEKCDLSKAFEQAFWEFSPLTEIVNFSAEDVVKEVKKTLARLHNEKRYHATTKKDMQFLEDLERMVDTVAEKRG